MALRAALPINTSHHGCTHRLIHVTYTTAHCLSASFIYRREMYLQTSAVTQFLQTSVLMFQDNHKIIPCIRPAFIKAVSYRCLGLLLICSTTFWGVAYHRNRILFEPYLKNLSINLIYLVVWFYFLYFVFIIDYSAFIRITCT